MTKEVRVMRILWGCGKNIFLASALLLASMSWYNEVQAQSASLRLTWTDTSDNEDGFKIERLVAGLVDAAGGIDDSGLVNGVIYCYRVKAFNSGGESLPSNQPCMMAQTTVVQQTTLQQTSIAATPTIIGVGGTVTATWSGIAAPKVTDWIGLYLLGAADTNFLDWIYVSCSKSSTIARASGSCSYVLPGGLAAGSYELRLFADSYTRLAISNGFTVTTGGTASPTLTVNPKTAKAGATVTASWNAIPVPTPKDWIGLYTPGAADTKFINWMYVSCSTVAGSARSSGSCSYGLPAKLSAGSYELRLFANDGYTRLATSNTLTVSTSSKNTKSIVLANSVSTGNGSSTDLLPQIPREWTDYDLQLNLRSMNNSSIGVMFRYQDDRNYYKFVWNQKSKFRRLEKIENGTSTALANDAVGYVKGTTYQLQIVAQGATLRVFIDGAQIFSVADSTFAKGTIGLYSSTNQASFDNIVVQDLATGGVLLSDDFNDGDFTGWTIVDQGTNEGSSVWSAETGSLVQSSKISATFALYTARNWTDYRLSTKLKSMDTRPIGIMFRYQDNKNYYRFAWDAQNKSRLLEKVQNGIATTLAQDAKPYVTGQTYNLAITTQGTLLEVRIDGTAVFSATDSTFSQGTVALYSQYNQGGIFDDIGVQDLATGAVLVAEDFNDGNFIGWTIIDDKGASMWSAQNGALIQTNKIGSNVSGNVGTFAVY